MSKKSSTNKPRRISKISDLSQDNRNANRGSKAGSELIQRSLKEYGAGRSILIDRDGRIIAGNQLIRNAGVVGLDDVQIVQSDGTKIIAVQRTDLSLDDKKARELALADNRSSEIGLDWDSSVLASFATEIELPKIFDARFINKMFETPDAEKGTTVLPEGFGVLIEKLTEEQQVVLLQELSGKGYTVKAITF